MSKVTRTNPQMQAIKPAAQPAPRKSGGGDKHHHDKKSEADQKSGRTSSFESMRAVGGASLGGVWRNSDGETRGRMTGKGTADDSIGRMTGKGTADDSIGRMTGQGTADDSIGRMTGKGTADDSIGRQVTPTISMNGLAGFRTMGATSQGSVGRITSEDLRSATNGLTKKAHERARSLSLRDPSANKVLSSPSFRKLQNGDRESIIKVMAQGGRTAATAMAKLFKTKQEGVLFKQDSAGSTVLANVERIAQSKRGRVAGEVLADIADPNRIQQGYAPTCTATSMQYELAKDRPPEYARLMAGLAVEGRATMQGGGVLAVRAKNAVEASDMKNDYRTDSEAIFQSAVMEYANGSDNYDLKQQRSEGAGRTYRGLFPDQIRDMTGQLFGARYETRVIMNDGEARDELPLIMSRERPNRPVLFDISMGSFNHNVSLERVDDQRVSFRDPTTGDIIALTRDEFVNRLTSVHYAVD